MMLPTHVVIGLAVGAPVLIVAPEFAPVVLFGVLVGSIFPDFDMYIGHRRTLHFPTVYTAMAVLSLPIAVFLQHPVTVGVVFALIGAALHSRMDRYGGGLELEPWRATSNQAVYDHVQRRWLTPKRWIRYDGAPEDFMLTAALGIPLVFVLEGDFKWVVVAALCIGGVYTIFRRRLARLAIAVSRRVPAAANRYIPLRYQ